MKKFDFIIGQEYSIFGLSCELCRLGCEDIYDFGNLDEILISGEMIVATDECGENHIQISFDVKYLSEDDEDIFATIVYVKDIQEI